MALTKLKFNPGINRETTSYAGENGWFDGDFIRFRMGNAEKIGGWTKEKLDFNYLKPARKLFPWVDLELDRMVAIGTSSKFYIALNNKLYDVTALRTPTATLAANPFNLQSGSSLVTVTHSSHGAFTGDFVTFGGVADEDSNITKAVLEQEYKLTKVDNNTYTINARAVATIPSITVKGVIVDTPVTAASTDTTRGGSSVTVSYTTNSAQTVAVVGRGFGAGDWNGAGRGWDAGASITGSEASIRVWTVDNFGEDLIFCAKNGDICYWDTSAKKSAMGQAILLKDYTSADSTTPQVATGILVSDTDRHIIAYGAGSESSPTVQDPLLIRFCSQGDPSAWQSLATNTAGSLNVSSGNQIITAVQTKQEILIITDKSIHSMQFIGPPLTFGIKLVSENITIAGNTSVVSIDDTVYWMGAEEFYVYQGAVNKIPCTVRDYVFDDFNTTQKEQVVAGSNAAFGEVWWFYCSAGSETNDRYVVYNYQEQLWYYGTLSRETWVDRGLFPSPFGAKNGELFNHESGLDDNSSSPPAPINAYLQSADLDIQEGDDFLFMSRIIPDLSFKQSENESGTASFIVKSKNSPGNNYNDSGSSTTTASVTKDSSAAFEYGVDSYTDVIDVRIRARSFAFRIETNETGVDWRLGYPRVDIKPDGKR